MFVLLRYLPELVFSLCVGLLGSSIEFCGAEAISSG